MRWSTHDGSDLLLLLVMGCAHAGADAPSERTSADRAAAQRIYAVAEEHYAAGDYDEAVALMRHSLLQLPASPEHDPKPENAMPPIDEFAK